MNPKDRTDRNGLMLLVSFRKICFEFFVRIFRY